MLAPRADGVLVLVRHGKTKVQDLQAAKDALDAVSGRILGSVMTMAPHAGKQRYASNRADSGSSGRTRRRSRSVTAAVRAGRRPTTHGAVDRGCSAGPRPGQAEPGAAHRDAAGRTAQLVERGGARQSR